MKISRLLNLSECAVSFKMLNYFIDCLTLYRDVYRMDNIKDIIIDCESDVDDDYLISVHFEYMDIFANWHSKSIDIYFNPDRDDVYFREDVDCGDVQVLCQADEINNRYIEVRDYVDRKLYKMMNESGPYDFDELEYYIDFSEHFGLITGKQRRILKEEVKSVIKRLI